VAKHPGVKNPGANWRMGWNV